MSGSYPNTGHPVSSSPVLFAATGSIAERVYSVIYRVRFEVSTTLTMKNGVFWDVTPCGCCKSQRFGGT
jgi:hypothetical protein